MNDYPENWNEIATGAKDSVSWICIRCDHPHDVKHGYVMTVHHFDGDKANCEWWNLIPLCQRCHLSVQARMDWSKTTSKNCPVWLLPYMVGRMMYLNCDTCMDICACRSLIKWFEELYANVWNDLQAEQFKLPGL